MKKPINNIAVLFLVLAVAAAAYDVWVLYENYFHPPVVMWPGALGFAGYLFQCLIRDSVPTLGLAIVIELVDQIRGTR